MKHQLEQLYSTAEALKLEQMEMLPMQPILHMKHQLELTQIYSKYSYWCQHASAITAGHRDNCNFSRALARTWRCIMQLQLVKTCLELTRTKNTSYWC
jgi:hypothetical protein